ncbi:PREDICTED: sperm-associated antigen 4 protein-like [Calidris pugnax]|uniref:sperm-associated antigen 4 protein-like n=1 Tax=Calidris pugnax TaxID=198806 RepID=UPI00071CE381|nr:PREDICTED: sperm-associated antigen 4 protein-like [Calidris pugnax]XP_014820371.1 PREDICTED: sperm-associated antigen 4 protein-like [Calidris pugnax]
MSLAALAAACWGIVQLTWRQRAEDVLQIGFSGGRVEQSPCLRNEVVCLADEMDTMKKAMLQPDDFPTCCWPFQESGSEVLSWLPAQIPLQAVSVQQSSERASPLGTAISARRDVAVCGLDEEGEEATLLGTWSCSRQEKPHQSLPLQNGIPGAFQLTNPGNWSSSGTPAQRLIDRVLAMGKMVGRWWASLDLFSSIKFPV